MRLLYMIISTFSLLLYEDKVIKYVTNGYWLLDCVNLIAVIRK